MFHHFWTLKKGKPNNDHPLPSAEVVFDTGAGVYPIRKERWDVFFFRMADGNEWNNNRMR